VWREENNFANSSPLLTKNKLIREEITESFNQQKFLFDRFPEKVKIS
jgi:hypothetical protein